MISNELYVFEPKMQHICLNWVPIVPQTHSRIWNCIKMPSICWPIAEKVKLNFWWRPFSFMQIRHIGPYHFHVYILILMQTHAVILLQFWLCSGVGVHTGLIRHIASHIHYVSHPTKANAHAYWSDIYISILQIIVTKIQCLFSCISRCD
jgi:hypothetical protein